MTKWYGSKHTIATGAAAAVFLASAMLGLAFPEAAGHAESPVKWGPWRWQDMYTSGIDVRTKCLSTANGDSKWAYQFRSHVKADFVERVEQAVPDSPANELGPPAMFSPHVGERSAVFHTDIHGSCEKLKEIQVKIVCVLVLGAPADCAKDADGHPLDIQPYSLPPGTMPLLPK